MSAAKTGTPLDPLLKNIMVAGEPFHQLVEYGGKGLSHWAQVLCPSCGTWLRTQPDRSEKSGSSYTYFWTCLNCGVVRKQRNTSPPESWSIDPEATEQVPGSSPPLAVWEPYAWLDGTGLPMADIALVREGWSSLAEFALKAGSQPIGRSAILDAEAEVGHSPEPLIEAVRIELEADALGRRVLEGPRLWERADDFMQEVARPLSDDSWRSFSVNYRITFADRHVLDGSTQQFADDRASLSWPIRSARQNRYLSNLRSQPEHIQKLADEDRAFLSRYKLGPGRHEPKEVAEDMFAAPQTLAEIRKALDERPNRLRVTARDRRFENAPEPIQVSAAALKLAAEESVCEALEDKDPVTCDQAKEAMVRLGRLGSYVPIFEVPDHPALQERLKKAGAVVRAYEMMHSADTSAELRSDRERLTQALEAWRAHLEASRA